jgi:hypothetical protein
MTEQEPLPFEPEVFEQRVEFTPAKNWLAADSSRNYGHIGMKIIFSLIGPRGAITTVISPSWYIKSSRDAWTHEHRSWLKHTPDIWDLSYHAYEPQYEDQTSCPCTLLRGGRCYSDGTTLNEELCEGFLAGGSDWLWKKLRQVYDYRFHGAAYPSFAPEYIPHPDAGK